MRKTVARTHVKSSFRIKVRFFKNNRIVDHQTQNTVLNFPSTGAPGFDFNITGTVAKESSEWTLDIVGTVEGYAIFNESVSACGKISVPIGPKPYSLFIGSIDIDFPSCPASVGTDISITGKVHLYIPIPYGFGAVVSVKVSDKASGSMINCEEVDVSSTLLPPPNATGANVIVAGDSWGSFGAKPFANMFTKHGATNVTVYNMAAGGTTSDDWSHGPILNALKNAVSLPSASHVWISFGGNDAIERKFIVFTFFFDFARRGNDATNI